ncbi:hypothetical protein GCM10025872_23880 [Barrientosiimonas endolithica]|uniref:FAD dependent oxidoreductase domain-containing protein n=1 Tax=Barrientosiimonas endolithica TaxID=1535208 RepID=A0ABM8HCP6_9MICO|nr:hypothetical protein GCM10025872_23880 [Barrientosiimonas endolithica]
MVTRARVDELDAERVTLTDTLTGERLTVRARTVVNSTGVWADRHDDRITVLPSRGSHLVLPAAAVGSPRAALTVPLPGSTSRFLLVLPRPDDQVLVGLTDEPAPGVDPLEPPVPEADEQLLLEGVSRALRSPVTSADVVGRFAGLRPLVVRDDKPSADVSREHLLLDEPGRPLTIAGGKLTTYRRMAQDTVDAVARRLGRGGECRTATLPCSVRPRRPTSPTWRRRPGWCAGSARSRPRWPPCRRATRGLPTRSLRGARPRGPSWRTACWRRVR